jgi:hypothetical protein
MPSGTTVYALWGGALLPSEVSGSVLTRRYDNVEANLESSLVESALPTFVLVG